MIHMLSIEIDGHFHGRRAPRPWVAEVVGTCPQYGLRREFVPALNDWEDARRACSGNLYGVVANFPLRDGRLYEVSRCRGRSSKRYVAREFVVPNGPQLVECTPDEALARADGGGPATILRVQEDEDPRPWVAGDVWPGFVLVDGWRRYRLHEGRTYQVCERGECRFVRVTDGKIVTATRSEAQPWV